MEDGRIIQGQRQAKGVRHGVGPCQRGVAHGPCLVWIAQMPQGMSEPATTKDAYIHAEQDGMCKLLRRVVKRNPLFHVLTSRHNRSQTVQRCPYREMT